MAENELFRTFLDRLEEAQVYCDQDLREGLAEIIDQIRAELEASALSDDQKEHLRTQIQSRFEEKMAPADTAPEAAKADTAQSNPSQAFEYGVALMDSQFWEEAMREFKRSAGAGYRVAQSLEKCGDCAVHLERWDAAIRYYETIYSNPKITEIYKNQILLKITRCSQTQKKIVAKSSPYAKSGASRNETATASTRAEPEVVSKVEAATTSVAASDQSSFAQFLGQTLRSWQDEKGECLPEKPCSYRILNLVHIGITSQVVELEREGSGERFAGQILNSSFTRSIDLKSLAQWARTQMMLDSHHLARVHDVGLLGDTCVIVREYLSTSLLELLSSGSFLPIPLAIFIAHRMIEGLGDLHLHMGRDNQIRNLLHLDLRPSRILLHTEKPIVKIYNSGLWKVLETANPTETLLRNLPLPFLAYRAPEQFRPYLARRKQPFFTDIYLFGTIFYEMLTGNPPFRASSFEEYEIQHCDQYPTPPKVWRPEIPSEINDTIMKCLEVDPLKRWRSFTQISLDLEKTFSQDIYQVRNGSFAKYLQAMK